MRRHTGQKRLYRKKKNAYSFILTHSSLWAWGRVTVNPALREVDKRGFQVLDQATLTYPGPVSAKKKRKEKQKQREQQQQEQEKIKMIPNHQGNKQTKKTEKETNYNSDVEC